MFSAGSSRCSAPSNTNIFQPMICNSFSNTLHIPKIGPIFFPLYRHSEILYLKMATWLFILLRTLYSCFLTHSPPSCSEEFGMWRKSSLL